MRVCTNRTCARQGGREVLAALAGLAPPRVDVDSCGCLGRCGAGPNVAASVGGSAAVFGHVGTAARGAQLLEHFLGAAEFDAAAGLSALAAREKAEAALEKGSAAEAEGLLNEVWPSGLFWTNVPLCNCACCIKLFDSNSIPPVCL